MHSQSISDYQWKNRVLVVKHNDRFSDAFLQQEAEFRGEEGGLKERKMLIVYLDEGSYRLKDYMKDEKHSFQIFDKLNLNFEWREEASFEVVLIGLDGGVKMRRDVPLPVKELYALIDGMPMRRAELSNKFE